MLKELQEIAIHAGNLFSEHLLNRIDQKEGHANFVTNIDQEVEDYLQKALLKLIPGSQMIGEEKENDSLTDRPTWIVDPVDGTTNLIHDFRMSAVSIALCEEKMPVVGLVYQPYSRELFLAEKGKGAMLNGKPIQVSRIPFEKALISFGTSPYNAELSEKSMELALAFLRDCADIRRSGSAAIDLANVACGRTEAFFELKLRPWDYAAGSLLVQEAGGFFSMPFANGEPQYDLSTAIVASNRVCAQDVTRVIKNTRGRSFCADTNTRGRSFCADTTSLL